MTGRCDWGMGLRGGTGWDVTGSDETGWDGPGCMRRIACVSCSNSIARAHAASNRLQKFSTVTKAQVSAEHSAAHWPRIHKDNFS